MLLLLLLEIAALIILGRQDGTRPDDSTRRFGAFPRVQALVVALEAVPVTIDPAPVYVLLRVFAR